MADAWLYADTIGLFVQMIVVALCSVFLVAVIGLHAKNKKKQNEISESGEDSEYLPETEPILPVLASGHSDLDHKASI